MSVSPKNILYIIADQFRHDCLGAAGNPLIQTPNLDRLAAEGTLFKKCFVQTTPCGPNRMCIFTSRYLCCTRSGNNMTPLENAHLNVAMVLRQAEYAPAIIGYNDYAIDPAILPEGDPRKTGLNYDNFLPGFDVALDHEYDSPEYFASLRDRGYPEDLLNHEAIHNPDVPPEGTGDHLPLHYPAHYRAEDSEAQFLTSTAIDYIQGRGDVPWMASVNYIKPHPPRICASPYHELYDPADMPLPNRIEEELGHPHPYLRWMHRDPRLVEERDLRETQACYYGMITELDACLGRLFDALKAAGRWDDTLIIFSSDHGEYLGDHYFTDKAHFYDETMRVPLIIRDPSPEADATRGEQLDMFCESIDAAPTMLDYAGVSIPQWMQGRSLLGLIRNQKGARPRDFIVHECDFRVQFAGVEGVDPDECLFWVIRDDDYKYVQFAMASMPPLLFEMRRDPGEHTNLAELGAYRVTVLHYCQKLLRWRMKHEDQRMEHWASQYR
jgi:arylsulfatase A-like enzyme